MANGACVCVKRWPAIFVCLSRLHRALHIAVSIWHSLTRMQAHTQVCGVGGRQANPGGSRHGHEIEKWCAHLDQKLQTALAEWNEC